MSRQEKFRQKQGQGFVGRRGELAVFEANLRRSVEDHGYQFIFHVRGQSGVGKSALVRRWKGYAEEAGAASVFLSDEVHGPLEAMKAVRDQLARQGLELASFTKRLAQLRQRQRESERALPRDEGSPGVELAAHGALTAAGAAVGVPLSVDQLARSAGRMREQARERRDSELVHEPVDELTPVFVTDLTDAARDRPWVVLFFDVYERTGPSLDRWLRDLVAGERYGELPLKVIVVMSGQGRLATSVWGEMAGHVADVLLEAFTEEEARDLLARRGVLEEEVVRSVLSLSDRLPVLVDMLATPRPTQPGEVIDPAETAVERFLKWETDPERRQAILACALPPEIDGDIYRALVAPDATGGAETWLASLPFITSHGGRYRYHDVVRSQILRLQRSRSASDWRQRHTALADHHARQRAELETALRGADNRWENEGWRDQRAAEMYHRLCANPLEARLPVLEDCVHACGESVESFDRWVRLIQHAGNDAGSAEVTGWADPLTAETGRPDPVAALGTLVGEPALSAAARSRAYAVRASHHGKAGDHGSAIADLTRAIELNPHDAWNHHWRGRAHRRATNYESAVADLTRAIELDPGNDAHHRWRGAAHGKAGDRGSAVADLTRAIELNPRDPWNHHWRGITHYQAGDHRQAIRDLTSAIELNPDNDAHHYWRGAAHGKAKDNRSAIIDLTRAIELNPGNAWNHRWRGRAHRQAGNLESAVADLTRAIELNPHDAWNHHWRGITHYQAGDHRQAIRDLTSAIQLNPHEDSHRRWRIIAGYEAEGPG